MSSTPPPPPHTYARALRNATRQSRLPLSVCHFIGERPWVLTICAVVSWVLRLPYNLYFIRASSLPPEARDASPSLRLSTGRGEVLGVESMIKLMSWVLR